MGSADADGPDSRPPPRGQAGPLMRHAVASALALGRVAGALVSLWWRPLPMAAFLFFLIAVLSAADIPFLLVLRSGADPGGPAGIAALGAATAILVLGVSALLGSLPWWTRSLELCEGDAALWLAARNGASARAAVAISHPLTAALAAWTLYSFAEVVLPSSGRTAWAEADVILLAVTAGVESIVYRLRRHPAFARP